MSNNDDSIPELAELMQLDQVGFRQRFKNSAVLRTKRKGLLRNVAVALGNWGNPSAIPALKLGLQDSEPLVRTHAAWGLGRINDESIPSILEESLNLEEDPQVIQEIREALSAWKGNQQQELSFGRFSNNTSERS